MKMDDNGSDASPSLSDNKVGTWMQCWDNEDSSLSGLNLDSVGPGLHELVEDKEIAAKAVAFVVSSTRKGIVPLCSNVASLFRTKKQLESRIARLKTENESLRSQTSSLRTSQTSSPPYTDRDTSNQERSRPCSQCSSQCSSYIGESPRLDKAPTFFTRSPKLRRPSAFTPSTNANSHLTVEALAHSSPNGMNNHSMDHVGYPAKYGHWRKNSLPEIVSEPLGSVPKVNPKTEKVSKEVQCVIEGGSHSDARFEEQFRETVKLNSKLSEDLGAAKKEIEVLKGRLKELEMNQLARQYMDHFHMEDECQSSSSCPDSPVFIPAGHRVRQAPSPTNSEKRRSSPLLIPGPLEGCRCTSCERTLRKEDPGSEIETESSGLIVCDNKLKSRKLHIETGDHIVVKGEKTGYVRYLGHLDNVAPANAVFVGLELDAPVGRHDGAVNGKRYFSCAKDHAVFLPLQDVICIISKKSGKLKERHKPKLAKKFSDSSSRHGVRSRRTSDQILPSNPLKSEEHEMHREPPIV